MKQVAKKKSAVKKSAVGKAPAAGRAKAGSAVKSKPKSPVKPKAAVKPKAKAVTQPKAAAKPKAATKSKAVAKPKAIAKPKAAATPKKAAVKAKAVVKKAAPAAKKTGVEKTPARKHAAAPAHPAAKAHKGKAPPVASAPRLVPKRELPVPVVAVTPVPVPIKKDPRLVNNWKKKPAQELSDAEVIAMPDGEYMNDAQMAFFRHRLVQIKSDILANAGQTTENLREDTVVVPDPADRATIEEEHALELRTRDRERKLLKKIEQSIARIDTGDYGYCDETGEPIGVARLLARPTATLSLEAQQRRELKQKMFGD